jgi:hypothetical protein
VGKLWLPEVKHLLENRENWFRDPETGKSYPDPGWESLLKVKGAMRGVKTPKDIRKEDIVPINQFDDQPERIELPAPQGDAMAILAQIRAQKQSQQQSQPQPIVNTYQQQQMPQYQPFINQKAPSPVVDRQTLAQLIDVLANYMPVAHFQNNPVVQHVLSILA